jgi:DNA-binding MarR family transcriptional regulator
MRYTYIVIDDDLDELDELLVRIRVAQQRPDWRRRLLSGSAHRLGLSDLRVLRAVERRPEASIGDVADDLGIKHSTASRAVTQVVRAGFLVKSSSPGDQRRTSLEVTDIGRQALRDMTARRREMVAEVVIDWMPSDIARLNELLGRLADGFEAEQS